jgi:hypothetical protein
MVIDLNIPLGLNRKVKEPMPRKKGQHVIKEGNPRADIRRSLAVKVER